ncbi:hypothetical protein [Streptomyces sp. NPDC058279]|uniref:hypothetical protein n=1 Tax=Streptomyces sp. NPDC058279 TaxID=3346418 RepID=UPI0036E5BB2E
MFAVAAAVLPDRRAVGVTAEEYGLVVRNVVVQAGIPAEQYDTHPEHPQVKTPDTRRCTGACQ